MSNRRQFDVKNRRRIDVILMSIRPSIRRLKDVAL